jgi:hypothetical protein
MIERSRQRERQEPPVREGDLQPYPALRWVGTLFKAGAVFLLVAVVGQLVAGVRAVGAAIVPGLVGELARTLVLAVVLWAAGDLVRLLVQAGHDLRAQRILLQRLVHRVPARAGDDDGGPAVQDPSDRVSSGSVSVQDDSGGPSAR